MSMTEPSANTGNRIIESISRNRHKVTLYFNDGDTLTISENNYINNGYFYPGKEITQEQIDTLLEYQRLETGRSYVYNLLSRGDYTSTELVKRLIRVKHIPEDDALAIISEMIANEVINDRIFAERYIEECRQKGYPKETVLHNLIKREIDPTLSEIWLSDYEQDQDAVNQLLENCMFRYRNKPYNLREQYVIEYLADRGFNRGQVYAMLKDYRERNGGPDAKHEAELLKKAADEAYARVVRNGLTGREAKRSLVRALRTKGFEMDDILELIEGEYYEFD